MAEFEPGRSRGWLIVAVSSAVLGLGFVASPAVGLIDSPSGIDIPTYSARAAAWSEANTFHRSAAVERAIQAAVEREERIENERKSALAAASATTGAPTTVPPTAVPTTSAPPATTPPTTTESLPETPEPSPQPESATASDPIAETGGEEASQPGPSAEQWEALRQCESGGRYDAVSSNGLYRGAYQFSQTTWDWVASFANPVLIGVDPAAASAADQDAQAQALYERSGAGPWPHCGVHLQ